VAERKRTSKRAKLDTSWYDALVLLYQKTRDLGLDQASSSLRNVGWECMRGIVHGKVRDHIKTFRLLHDRDLCQKLFQDSFFIYTKACNIWDYKRKTKFLTFLGDILPQELRNVVSLDRYHNKRDYKLEKRLRKQVVDEPIHFFDEIDQERKLVLEEIRELLEKFSFGSEVERDIANILIYGKLGDWGKLQKKSGLKSANFAKARQDVALKLREYILSKCSEHTKNVLKEILGEK